MRTISLEEGEYYHVFNRGVEKRDIFLDLDDLSRFIEGMQKFKAIKPIGSLYENRFRENRRHRSYKTSLGSSTPKLDSGSDSSLELVELVCYCLNPNHFHMILKQCHHAGIQKYMQRLGTGYTNYFNEKYKRSGVLFQGAYKAVHIESNEQLLHTSVYVNLNDQLGSSTPKLSRSSWAEFIGFKKRRTSVDICKKEVILEQFNESNEYSSFATDSLTDIILRKQEEKEMKWLLGSSASK